MLAPKLFNCFVQNILPYNYGAYYNFCGQNNQWQPIKHKLPDITFYWNYFDNFRIISKKIFQKCFLAFLAGNLPREIIMHLDTNNVMSGVFSDQNLRPALKLVQGNIMFDCLATEVRGEEEMDVWCHSNTHLLSQGSSIFPLSSFTPLHENSRLAAQ